MTIQLYENKIFISTKQIDETDLPEINKLNIKSIICNRYDDEELNQPKFIETKKLLLANGIKNIVYQPIIFHKITIKDAILLENYLKNNPKPILLYCKTGTRSVFLISIIKSYHLTNLKKILSKAEDLSYYLDPYKEFFQNIIDTQTHH